MPPSNQGVEPALWRPTRPIAGLNETCPEKQQDSAHTEELKRQDTSVFCHSQLRHGLWRWWLDEVCDVDDHCTLEDTILPKGGTKTDAAGAISAPCSPSTPARCKRVRSACLRAV